MNAVARIGQFPQISKVSAVRTTAKTSVFDANGKSCVQITEIGRLSIRRWCPEH
jgi:hypothetical protein